MATAEAVWTCAQLQLDQNAWSAVFTKWNWRTRIAVLLHSFILLRAVNRNRKSVCCHLQNFQQQHSIFNNGIEYGFRSKLDAYFTRISRWRECSARFNPWTNRGLAIAVYYSKTTGAELFGVLGGLPNGRIRSGVAMQGEWQLTIRPRFDFNIIACNATDCIVFDCSTSIIQTASKHGWRAAEPVRYVEQP